MAENTTVVDARGLSCPQPVLDVKRVIENAPAGNARIDVLVDTVTSRENVARFARNAGWNAEAAQEEGCYRVKLERAAGK